MTEWHRRWDEGRIGFHIDEVNPTLVEHRAVLGEGGRVLVPLCGKTVDLPYLAKHGFAPVGVELVEKAVIDFFTEQGLPHEVEGDAHRGGGVEIRLGDIMKIELEPVDAIWDRASMVALPPEVRPGYVERLLGWLKPGGRVLLVTFDYDQTKMDGPPFAVPDDEVRAAYGDHGALERLDHEVVSGPGRFGDLEVTQSVWSFKRA